MPKCSITRWAKMHCVCYVFAKIPFRLATNNWRMLAVATGRSQIIDFRIKCSIYQTRFWNASYECVDDELWLNGSNGSKVILWIKTTWTKNWCCVFFFFLALYRKYYVYTISVRIDYCCTMSGQWKILFYRSFCSSCRGV